MCFSFTEKQAGITRTCPEGATINFNGDGCVLRFGHENIKPIATPCPDGWAFVGGGGINSCVRIYPRDGEIRTSYECPAEATLNGTTCSAHREIQVNAIEKSNIEYSCPAGSTGQPTEANPWCQKSTT